jgi:transposase
MPVHSPTCRLSDAQYEKIQGLLPQNDHRCGQWEDHRPMIDGILWALSDGGRWCNLPDRFGPWKSVYDRFRRWCGNGPWDRILRHLPARKMNSGEINFSLFCIDGTVVRAHQSAAGVAKKSAPGRAGRPRAGPQPGGFGTKLHLICDGEGTPIAVAVGPGQEHETQRATELLEEATAWPEQPAKVAGDKGYSAGWLREWLQERGTTPVIAHQKNEKGRKGRFDRKAYRKRNVVERCVGSLKWFRRVATRYEKRATHYLGRVTLAITFRLA